MAEVNSTPSPGGRALSTPDDAFQKLLLQIAAKAAERGGAATLIQFFCHATREFFQASGVYFWRRHAGDELVGEQADGKLAERFIGIRLLFQDGANTADILGGLGGGQPPEWPGQATRKYYQPFAQRGLRRSSGTCGSSYSHIRSSYHAMCPPSRYSADFAWRSSRSTRSSLRFSTA